jgi:hypothetical protein
MKFCPDCKFMLYTSIYSYDKDSNESKQEGGDEKKTTNKLNLDIPGQLLYYCKNCGWEEVEKTDEMNTNNQCIYKRNYQEDYIADRVICNKYTIYDNTLPRVTYECINNDCPTNLDIENLTDENNTYIMIDNLPPDATDEEIDMAFIDDADKIFKTTRVKLAKYIVQFNTVADKQLFQQKYTALNKEINGYKINLLPFEKPRKEVLYIKYDNINMKYLYICANCGTSWKKN